MQEIPVELTVPQLESTFGVLFIGYIISMVAYGFTFFQTYLYFSRYPLDRRYIKATVASLCLLDTLNSALISHTLYHYLVTLFPLTTGLIHATSTYCAEIGFSVLAVFIVQMFYSYRIWRVSKSGLATGLIALFSTAAFAIGLVFTSMLIKNPSFTSLEIPQTKGIMAATQGLTLLSSTLSTVVLFFYLAPSRNPAVKPMEKLFDRIVTYGISRGTLATLLQLCFFIAFLATPGRAIWMAFHLIASKVFINSLLTMLNFRHIHHGMGFAEEEEVVVRKTSNATSNFSANGRRVSSNVRFGSMTSKVNIEISQTIEHDSGEASKVFYDDDEDVVDINWHQRRRKEAQSRRNSDAEL